MPLRTYLLNRRIQSELTDLQAGLHSVGAAVWVAIGVAWATVQIPLTVIAVAVLG